jgi:hypothetical protein
LLLTLCFAVTFDTPTEHNFQQKGRAAQAKGRAAQAQAVTNPASKANVPVTSFDFGDVYTGDVISLPFVIRNDGDADLRITDFKADCGCTVARSDRLIPPGKEGTAEVEILTVSQSGPIVKTATLHTNDPARPTIVFTLSANVLKGSPLRQGRFVGPVFLAPDSRASMYAASGKKARAELSVTANSGEVKLLGVEGGTKNFVSNIETIEPGHTYRIVIESIGIDADGLYKDRLRVITDNPALPSFNIDVALRVYPKN